MRQSAVRVVVGSLRTRRAPLTRTAYSSVPWVSVGPAAQDERPAGNGVARDKQGSAAPGAEAAARAGVCRSALLGPSAVRPFIIDVDDGVPTAARHGVRRKEFHVPDKWSSLMEERKVDLKRMREVWEEFGAHYDRLHAFYHDSVAGFVLFRTTVASDQETERGRYRGTELDTDEFWNGKRLAYDRLFGQDFIASGLHVGTIEDAKIRNEPDGKNFTTLANVCIIAFYGFWNDYLRREYCKAKGYHDGTHEELRKHASFDLWGDIRHLRNSIVHNRGIASDEIRNCKLIKCFQPGDPIEISPEQMRAIFHPWYQFRNGLHAESFEKRFIRVPG